MCPKIKPPRRKIYLLTCYSSNAHIFIELLLKSTTDCSHDIKRRFLLGRKGMTNLDSILKSRDITLPTNIYIVKAMVFPIVVYRCESYTIKKDGGGI